MIKESKISIGNFFKYKNWYCEVQSIQDGECEISVKNGPRSQWVPIEDLVPIPITENFFKVNGFKWDSGNNMWYSTPYSIYAEKLSSETWMCDVHTTHIFGTIYVEYIHELQYYIDIDRQFILP